MTQVIVVGSGQWGQNLVRNFHDLGALAGVVEVDPTLQARLRSQYPDLPIFERFEMALAGEAPAFVLATPAPTHFDLAMMALQAGKDVFVEKPMTLRSQEARLLAEYAETQERVLMVGHLLLYQPAIAWMGEYVRSGQMGQVLHVATQRLNLGKVRTAENVWWSFAPHDISIVLELLGHPTLARVNARGYARLQPGIEDEVHVDLTFATGQTAHLHCSWQWPVKQRGTVVIGDQQMLVYDEIRQAVTIHHKGIDGDLQVWDRGEEAVAIAHDQPLKLECQHFLDCVRTRQRPHSDGWNGVEVVSILEQVEEVLHG